MSSPKACGWLKGNWTRWSDGDLLMPSTCNGNNKRKRKKQQVFGYKPVIIYYLKAYTSYIFRHRICSTMKYNLEKKKLGGVVTESSYKMVTLASSFFLLLLLYNFQFTQKSSTAFSSCIEYTVVFDYRNNTTDLLTLLVGRI